MRRPAGNEIAIRRVLCPAQAIDLGTDIGAAFNAEMMLMAVSEDDPPQRLLALAERRHADLIVTSSTKQHITRSAAYPVLTLPPHWYSVTGEVVAHHGDTTGSRSS
jgi:hypothetical protein